jgi:hypothetical protein
MDHLHRQTLRDNARDSDTYCTCLGHLRRRDTDRIVAIGQGKKIRGDIARDFARDIALNIANVNMADLMLSMQSLTNWGRTPVYPDIIADDNSIILSVWYQVSSML